MRGAVPSLSNTPSCCGCWLSTWITFTFHLFLWCLFQNIRTLLICDVYAPYIQVVMIHMFTLAIQVEMFWVATPCNVVLICQCFGGPSPWRWSQKCPPKRWYLNHIAIRHLTHKRPRLESSPLRKPQIGFVYLSIVSHRSHELRAEVKLMIGLLTFSRDTKTSVGGSGKWEHRLVSLKLLHVAAL
jgi:hypothetical protein